jgi:hypothetical protein
MQSEPTFAAMLLAERLLAWLVVLVDVGLCIAAIRLQSKGRLPWRDAGKTAVVANVFSLLAVAVLVPAGGLWLAYEVFRAETFAPASWGAAAVWAVGLTTSVEAIAVWVRHKEPVLKAFLWLAPPNAIATLLAVSAIWMDAQWIRFPVM